MILLASLGMKSCISPLPSTMQTSGIGVGLESLKAKGNLVIPETSSSKDATEIHILDCNLPKTKDNLDVCLRAQCKYSILFFQMRTTLLENERDTIVPVSITDCDDHLGTYSGLQPSS